MNRNRNLTTQLSLLLVILALAALLAACGGGDTVTEEQTTVPEEATVAPAATEEVPTVAPTAPSSVADPALVGVTWEWLQRTSNLGQEVLITVPDPENYTLLFDAEGAFTAQKDWLSHTNGRSSTPPPSPLVLAGKASHGTW